VAIPSAVPADGTLGHSAPGPRQRPQAFGNQYFFRLSQPPEPGGFTKKRKDSKGFAFGGVEGRSPSPCAPYPSNRPITRAV